MFKGTDIKPFDSKVWLASPTMHGEELKYMMEAYETNWMSTVGKNINEVERIAAEKAEVKYAVALSCCTAALHLCVKFAGERLYGRPAISHGALEGKRVFCSDMTFDATRARRVRPGGSLRRGQTECRRPVSCGAGRCADQPYGSFPNISIPKRSREWPRVKRRPWDRQRRDGGS